MDDFKILLKSLRLKATPARLKLLNLLKKQKAPVSIKAIKKALGPAGADMATVYRNIESLKQEGLISELKISTREALYELANRPHHHHIVCESCGKLADVTDSEPQVLSSQILSSVGFYKVKYHSLEFFGICKACK